MKTLRTLLVLVVLASGLVGCADDFMTTVPPDAISEATFWKTEKDAIMGINAIYPVNYGGDIIWLDGMSDNGLSQKTYDQYSPMANGSYDANASRVNSFWQTSYQAIARANQLLAGIDGVETTNKALIERIKGEASFFRAYHYNLLTSLFGDVPLVLKPITIEEGKALTRNSKAEIVAQIYKDLDFAASVLPTKYTGADAGRVTKGAALALKARAALYAKDYQAALNASQAVIDLGIYSLYSDYTNLFRAAGEGSAEVIFDDQRLKNQRGQDAFNSLGAQSMQGISNIVPLADMVDEYETADGKMISRAKATVNPENPGGSPGEAHTYENRDPRFYATILHPGTEFAGSYFESRPGYPKLSDLVKRDFNTTATGWQVIKYVDPADRTDRSNSGNNFILIRYADVLLMFAEAKIELGQIDAAAENAINQVRARAKMPPVQLVGKSQADARAIVRHERRIELAFEGLRFFDVQRWGIGTEVMNRHVYGMTYLDTNGQPQAIYGEKRIYLDRHRLLPIPVRELDLNANLVQNPGW